MKVQFPSAHYSHVLFVTLVVALSSACTTPGPTKEMSLEEAKQITVSMSDRTAFVPPPRRIDDITAILNQPGQFDKNLTEKFVGRASATPPSGATEKQLSAFYKDRGVAEFELGDPLRAIEDLRLALRYAEEAKIRDLHLVDRLCSAEKMCGNFARAIELAESYCPARNYPGLYSRLVDLYCSIWNMDEAQKARDEAMSYCRRQGSRNLGCEREGAYMDAKLLESQQKAQEAEPHIRKLLGLFEGGLKERSPARSINVRQWLANNLLSQARLVEAELESRKALGESIAHTGKESSLTAYCLAWLGVILREEGRLVESEQLKVLGLDIMERLGIPEESLSMCQTRAGVGNTFFGKGNFSAAMIQYEKVKAATKGNLSLHDRFITRNPDAVLSHLLTGRPDEALKYAERAYERCKGFFGEKSWQTAAWLYLRGMAYYRMKNLERAVQDMSEGMEGLLLNRPVTRSYSGNWRFKIMLDDYIRLLDEIRGTPLERGLGRDAIGEAFRVVETSRGETVQWALSASSARAAVDDPATADLIRKEQDAAQQIQAVETALEELATVSMDHQDPKRILDMQQQMRVLRRAREAILAEIGKCFPKYVETVHPRPTSLSEVQKVLRPGEALISIYATENRTYVWAQPFGGVVQFASVVLGKKDLQEMVSTLRKALDPKPQTLNDIPDFDVNLAHQLFSLLLGPVREGWKDAGELLIMVNESLGQLPLAVLVTDSAGISPEKGQLFSAYQQVPWLIRRASITTLPSASSLISLRSLPPPGPGRLAFAGFGDPIFNPEQAATRETGQEQDALVAARAKGGIHVRGIRAISQGDLDGKQLLSCGLESLNRLPDTAEEITTVAGIAGGDVSRDAFLGRQASERRVKTMNLADRQIIAFATHGLVSGDLDGLDQPAIALSSPSVTGEGDKEDGLLTMGEIMKLRLNADWVVLSACNTAAADGAGAEALSGLVRAFFYAGTRSVLASMYPVETTSAKKLVTTTFKYQREDQTISRARALQRSMLDVMTGPGLVDPATGQVVCSYAHPLFWAPFVLVGDTGGHSR